jgi:hypothetical protein
MKLVTGNIKVKFRSHINYIFIKYIFSVKETHYQPNGKNIPGKITSKIYLKFFFPSNIKIIFNCPLEVQFAILQGPFLLVWLKVFLNEIVIP